MRILTVNQFILTLFGFMQRINQNRLCQNSQEKVLKMLFYYISHSASSKFVDLILIQEVDFLYPSCIMTCLTNRSLHLFTDFPDFAKSSH